MKLTEEQRAEVASYADHIERTDPTTNGHEVAASIRALLATSVASNQCDGCAVGAPLTERGNHFMPDGGFMGCTADRYGTPQRSVSTPVAKITGADEYGPLITWSKHWVDLVGQTLYVADTVAPSLTANDVERQYRDGVHIGSGLPRAICPCGFCAKHRNGFNRGDEIEPCAECGGSAAITCQSKHCPQVAQPDERAATWQDAFNERHEFDVYDDYFMTGLRNEFCAGWQAARATATQPDPLIGASETLRTAILSHNRFAAALAFGLVNLARERGMGGSESMLEAMERDRTEDAS